MVNVSRPQKIRVRCIDLQMLPIFCNHPSRNTVLTLHDESNVFRDIGRTCLRLWSFLSRDDNVRDYVSSDLVDCLNERSVKVEERFERQARGQG